MAMTGQGDPRGAPQDLPQPKNDHPFIGKNPPKKSATAKEVIEIAEEIGSGTEMPHRGTKRDKNHTYPQETQTERILRTMVRNIRSAQDFWHRIYRRGDDDTRFAYHEQWDPDARREREENARPVIQPTLIPQYINRVVGAAIDTKFSIHVQQTGGPSMKGYTANGTAIPFAEIMEGLIRDIEANSEAHMAYARGFQHAVESGVGWFETKVFMGPHDPFNPEVEIEHINDRTSVIVDHLAQKPNFQDANFGWRSVWMHRDDFDEKWPEYRLTDKVPLMTGEFGVTENNFYKENSVAVGKYFWKEPMRKRFCRLVHSRSKEELVLEYDSHKMIFDELKQLGYRKVEEREHNTYDVKVILACGHAILEGPYTWYGKSVPYIPVFGRQIDIDGEREYLSLHRHAKDSQIMYNYMASTAIERVAKAPNAPWLYTADQVRGWEQEWDEQHINSRDALIYNHIPDQPPPQRIPGAEIPQAEIALVGLCRQNLMEAIGLYQANLGQKSNETSGAAIQQRQMAGELGSIQFINNLTYSIATMGNILCEILPKIYSNEKMARLTLEDDERVEIILNNRLEDMQTDTVHTINNVGIARFASQSVAGPAFTSQRSEFLMAVTELGKTNPEMMTIIMDLVAKHMDFPGGRALEHRLKRMVPRQFLSPEEQAQMPPPEPTPEQQVEQMQMEQKQIDFQKQAQKAEIDITTQQIELQKEQVESEAQVKIHQLKLEIEKLKLEQEQAKAQELDAKLAEADATDANKAAEAAGKDREKMDADIERKVAAQVKKALAEMKSQQMMKAKSEAPPARKRARK